MVCWFVCIFQYISLCPLFDPYSPIMHLIVQFWGDRYDALGRPTDRLLCQNTLVSLAMRSGRWPPMIEVGSLSIQLQVVGEYRDHHILRRSPDRLANSLMFAWKVENYTLDKLPLFRALHKSRISYPIHSSHLLHFLLSKDDQLNDTWV
jgi:hypothetical protein